VSSRPPAKVGSVRQGTRTYSRNKVADVYHVKGFVGVWNARDDVADLEASDT
jgi:hypothetical protein